jgi:hypothetical protein
MVGEVQVKALACRAVAIFDSEGYEPSKIVVVIVSIGKQLAMLKSLSHHIRLD